MGMVSKEGGARRKQGERARERKWHSRKGRLQHMRVCPMLPWRTLDTSLASHSATAARSPPKDKREREGEKRCPIFRSVPFPQALHAPAAAVSSRPLVRSAAATSTGSSTGTALQRRSKRRAKRRFLRFPRVGLLPPVLPVLGQLAHEELVELRLEDTVGDELALLGHVTGGVGHGA